jgi:hypothetical protein
MKPRIVSFIGWYGVAATIIAYFLVSFSWLPATSLTYQLLNLTGALGVTYETWIKRDYQPFWLNLIWAGIAAVALFNLFIHIPILHPNNLNTSTSSSVATTDNLPATSSNVTLGGKVILTNLEPGAVVHSPLTITGKALGSWYFEAVFQVVLVDWDGKIIADGHAQAQSDWTSTGFVPFVAKLKYNTADISGNYSDKGTLIFKKDNPSGMPERDESVEMPVVIK